MWAIATLGIGRTLVALLKQGGGLGGIFLSREGG